MGIIPFIRNGLLYSGILLLYSVSIALNGGYILITGKPFHLLDLSLIVNELNIHWMHVLKEYGKSILISIILGLSGTVTFVYFRQKSQLRISNYWGLSVLFSFIFVFFIQYKTAATFQPPLPSFLNISAYGLVWPSIKPYTGDRIHLSEYPQGSPKYKNIVWIIDCSVNGDFLSINNTKWKTTPFLKSLESKMINRGVVASITNCSATSNIFLMGVGNQSVIPDRNETLLKSPNIFAYAKSAGFNTAYLSAQSHDWQLHNYVTTHDLEDIDYFHQPISAKERNPVFADSLLAKTVRKYLSTPDRNFIYVLKSGVHFPWEDNYPQSDPIQNSSLGERTTHYINALSWKTDNFFKILFEDLTILENSLFIYTSDHGQIIKEEGLYLTHCNTHNPEAAEGRVPLFYIGENLSSVHHHLALLEPQNHAELIPVTLHLMGYDIPATDPLPSGFLYGHLFPKHPLHQWEIKNVPSINKD